MKKLKKNMIALLSVFTLFAISVLPTFAAGDPIVTFDGDTELFTYKNVDTYTDTDGTQRPDLFTGFKGAIPGDVFTKEIKVKAVDIDGKTVKIYLRAENENEDFQTILDIEGVSYKVYYEGKEITTTMENGNILLGTFTADAEMDIKVEFSIDVTVGNEVSLLEGTIDWIFVAELIPDPEPEPEPKPDPETPKTGDDNNVILWIALMAVSVAGVGIYVKTKNGKNK